MMLGVMSGCTRHNNNTLYCSLIETGVLLLPKQINQAHKMDKAKAFHRSDGEKMKRARSTKVSVFVMVQITNC